MFKKMIIVILISFVSISMLTSCNFLGLSIEKQSTIQNEKIAELEEKIAEMEEQKLTTINIVPTETPQTVPTETLVVIETPTPIAVVCDTPSILASLDGQSFSEQGEYLDTVLGERMTFTNRKIVVPAKAWNDPLSDTELKAVETTWVSVQVCVPEGMTGTVFSGGFEQKLNRYENGVFMSLKAGMHEFKIRNGEIILWYPDQDSFANDDLDRIVEQIKVGNFDIKAPLAFFGVTTDLMPRIPAELVKERNVQIVPFPDFSVK